MAKIRRRIEIGPPRASLALHNPVPCAKCALRGTRAPWPLKRLSSQSFSSLSQQHTFAAHVSERQRPCLVSSAAQEILRRLASQGFSRARARQGFKTGMIGHHDCKLLIALETRRKAVTRQSKVCLPARFKLLHSLCQPVAIHPETHSQNQRQKCAP